ncbi:MAG: peptidoglycan editing factor PgeF [Hyphomicrobiaceae bacterium]|nr:peptidoglycan editing factor PgeF [Hyphomicrobiaceae bacterium]
MLKPVLIADLSALPGLAHGFFTRHGGVSEGVYASLNCGLGSKDRPEAVRANRARVMRHLGARDMVTAYQVHGTKVVVVDGTARGERPRADALVTAARGVAVGVLTADCAPVLLADPPAGVVAAAHAGWRGALAGVAEAALEAMESLGAKRARTHATVGPCIGPSVYEVGPEFEAQFLEHDAANARFFAGAGAGRRAKFDLSGYVAERLRRAGVVAVSAAGICSFSVQDAFFSYRRSQMRGEADYGRQISAIVLT